MNVPPIINERRPLYRSRNGIIFGVCKGLANYSDLSVVWIRIILVVLCLFTWFVPFVLAYLVAAILMPREPALEPSTDEDWEFYNSYASSRSYALARLKRQFDQIERRTRRMESVITAREYDWEHRLKTGL
jgi:phage shock protein C